MNAVMIYYSAGGKTAAIAKAAAEKSGIKDIYGIETAKPLRNFFSKIYSAFKTEKGEIIEIKPLGADVSGYDAVILAGPVWAGHLAPPLKSFAVKYGAGVKKIAYIIVSAGAKPEYEKLADGLDEFMGGERAACLNLKNIGWESRIGEFMAGVTAG